MLTYSNFGLFYQSWYDQTCSNQAHQSRKCRTCAPPARFACGVDRPKCWTAWEQRWLRTIDICHGFGVKIVLVSVQEKMWKYVVVWTRTYIYIYIHIYIYICIYTHICAWRSRKHSTIRTSYRCFFGAVKWMLDPNWSSHCFVIFSSHESMVWQTQIRRLELFICGILPKVVSCTFMIHVDEFEYWMCDIICTRRFPLPSRRFARSTVMLQSWRSGRMISSNNHHTHKISLFSTIC